MEIHDGAVIGKNLRPIFRDRDELPGAADLEPSILKALKESRFLIVLCSPNSARSRWVEKEIVDFKALAPGNEKRILALILDGEPNATSNPELDDALECFPPALRPPAEPLAGDLRKDGDGKERGFLKILSGISQLDFDTLYRRHERIQKRKRLSIGIAAATIILCLTVLTSFAFHQRTQANLAKVAAENSAAKERAAAEISERELYFAMIASAAEAARENSPLGTMSALAKCPPRQRAWEWHALARLTRFAPMVVHPDDIGLLDKGSLEGSGLLEASRLLLTRNGSQASYRETPHPEADNKENITTIATGPDRSGSEFFIKRLGSALPLAAYRTKPMGSVEDSWISPDGSVVVVLAGRFAEPMCQLGSTISDDPDQTWLHVLPVPLDVLFIPEHSTEEPNEDPPVTFVFPNGLLVVSSGEHPSLAGFPASGKSFAEGLSRIPAVQDATPVLLAHDCLKHLVNHSRETSYEAFRGNVGGAAPPVELLAINWKHAQHQLLWFDSRTGFHVGNLEAGEKPAALGFPGGSQPVENPGGGIELYPVGTFSDDGQMVAVHWSRQGHIAIFDSANGSSIATLPMSESEESDLGPPSSPSFLRFSPDNRFLTLIREYRHTRRIEIFELATSKRLPLQGTSGYDAVDWSTGSGMVAWYDVADEVLRLEQWSDRSLVRSINWSPGLWSDRLDTLQDFPLHNRLVAGNALLTNLGKREIMRLPDSWKIAPDGDWIAIAGRRSEENYVEGEYTSYNQTRVQIIRRLNDAGAAPHTLADQIRNFEIEYLKPE